MVGVDAQRVLNKEPKWRRGRLRDFVGPREICARVERHVGARMRVERIRSGLAAFEPGEDQIRSFIGSMPHTQVAISVKTQMHKNPRHTWTSNDISDVYAVSLAYAYCEASSPTKGSVTLFELQREKR